MRELDPNQFKLLCELQQVANRKQEIDEMICNQETKTRLMEGIRTASGTKLDMLSLYFTLPNTDIEITRDGANTPVTLDNV